MIYSELKLFERKQGNNGGQSGSIVNGDSKTSFTAPCELRKLKLSFLDQLAPGCYIPIIYFYSSTQLRNSIVDHSQISSQLKSSLSRILTVFYPLAGTIVDSCSVDCDDGGVEYSEARVFCTMSEIVDEPQRNLLLPLLHFQRSSAVEPRCDSRRFILGVRYNIFSCGGVAVAVSVSHKLCDGMSSTNFVKQWAAAACHDVANVAGPSFDAASLFPPTDLLGFGYPEPEIENIVTRRFLFSKANIAALREKITAGRDSDSLDKPPTRVEAISAFIWKRLLAVVRSKQQNAKPHIAIQLVNLRQRMNPPSPEHSLGNLWWCAVASTRIEEEENYPFLIKQVRKSIEGIDSETVKGLQKVESTLELTMEAGRKRRSGETEICSFTSWCRFPLYDVDFGWGRPIWVATPARPYNNMSVLMPTAGGDGVEAWIYLEKDVMAAFEPDPELLAFTS